MKKTKKVNLKAPKRNLFTLLIVLGGALALFFITLIITSYVKPYTDDSRKVEPFVTNVSSGYDLEDTIYMDGADFDEFGLNFQCTSYDDNAHKATFVVKTYENENFKNMIASGEFKITSSITVRVCLTANLSGKALYSTERTTNKLAPTLDDATSSNYKSEHTISNIIDLPFEIDCFPFDIKVKEPTAYVYVKYSFTRNGQSYTNSYILKYSYEEFNIVSGGIIK
jgi:hypothetical protein